MNSMRFWACWASILSASIVVTGCGSSAAAGTSTNTTAAASTATTPAPPVRPKPAEAIVLTPAVLGPGFSALPGETHAESLEQELGHESSRARAADRRSYLGGYVATSSNNVVAVISLAAPYRNARDAHISFTDPVGRRYGLSSLHAQVVTAPVHGPGQEHYAMVGHVTAGSAPIRIQMYLWRDGKILNAVALEGNSGSWSELLQLVRLQDSRARPPA